MDSDDMTIGEVGRRLVRIEDKLDKLSDANTRITRLEQLQVTAEARAWQAKLALVMALLGLPLSIASGIVVALMKG